mmetsp:Transcript_55082/g.163945  ORF Transcript_55082/g.163945 Transcript_55082/m.163945 type:complete len:234 (-) Transcript_55082:88-789(-)
MGVVSPWTRSRPKSRWRALGWPSSAAIGLEQRQTVPCAVSSRESAMFDDFCWFIGLNSTPPALLSCTSPLAFRVRRPLAFVPPPSPSPRPPPPKSSRGARPCCLAHSAASDAPPSRCLGRQASKDVTFIFSKARCADSLFSSAARAFGVMSSVCSLASRLVMPASVKPLPWYPAGLPASSPNLAHLRRASTDLRILIACFATLTVRTVLILKPNSLVLYVVIVLMPFMSGSDS